MLKLLKTTLISVLAVVASSAFANNSPSPLTEAAIDSNVVCVAVMERELRSKIHLDGTEADRSDWLKKTEHIYILAAKAYFSGLTKEQGRAMLKDATVLTEGWPAQKSHDKARECESLARVSMEEASLSTLLLVRKGADNKLSKELRKLGES